MQLTPLTLCQPPADAADCYCLRTFTSVENGVVRDGTLRTASCVRKGMAFAGELTCAGEDVPLLKNALGCIRWMAPCAVAALAKSAFPAKRSPGGRTRRPCPRPTASATACARGRRF